jgi:hypothetical protein
MFSLKPPRHIPTLPIRVDFGRSASCPVRVFSEMLVVRFLPIGSYPRLAARSTPYSRMTFLRIVILLHLFV